jgi:hypothetical protein
MVQAPDVDKERLRQQMLLRALLGDARPAVVAGWLRERPERFARGLQAYRANAGATAERALAAAFPTVAALIGEAALAGLSRAFWRAEPPTRGDLAQWGEGLPAFIAADPQLAGEAYLADVARIDWAVHRAEMGVDAPAPAGLEQLAAADADGLRLQMAPGTTLVSSRHPVATIWQAHHASPAPEGADRFAPVRAAFAAGAGEHALVARGVGQWRARVTRLAEADARFTAAVLSGQALGQALASAGDEFEFEPWLVEQLQHGHIVAVSRPVAEA